MAKKKKVTYEDVLNAKSRFEIVDEMYDNLIDMHFATESDYAKAVNNPEVNEMIDKCIDILWERRKTLIEEKNKIDWEYFKK